MLSVSGLFLIIETLQGKINFRKLFIFPILSIILSMGLCFSVYFSQNILKSGETGTFREAENIVAFLSKNLKQNDIVLSPNFITQPILVYYFDKYKIDGLHYSFTEAESDLKSLNNIFLILKRDQNLNDIIDFNYFLENKYYYPEELRSYGFYYLYKIQKIN